jgi:hypothetical protein
MPAITRFRLLLQVGQFRFQLIDLRLPIRDDPSAERFDLWILDRRVFTNQDGTRMMRNDGFGLARVVIGALPPSQS